MIVVKIELWPHGDETKRKDLGYAAIALNAVSEDRKIGNYDVALSHNGNFFDKEGIWKSGQVIGHNRGDSVFVLIGHAIINALSTKKKSNILLDAINRIRKFYVRCCY